jgi:hypothetical protein
LGLPQNSRMTFRRSRFCRCKPTRTLRGVP